MIQRLFSIDRGGVIPSKWQRWTDQILHRCSQLERLDDPALKKAGLALRYRARSGHSLNRLLPETYALVRAAAQRTLGMQHYRVQVIGGIGMHRGAVAVMQTGEGKTLTATLPAALSALEGLGVHIATANDYLAQRDAETMRPLFEALGFRVGVVTADSTRTQRRAAYACDITYTTAKEIGFDFLRDRLALRQAALTSAGRVAAMLNQTELTCESTGVLPPLNALLVDEADSVLIDEARTPLVVSAPPNAAAKTDADLFAWAAGHAPDFIESEHFDIDPDTDQVELNQTGRKRVRRLPLPQSAAATAVPDLYEYLQRAIYVRQNYARERDYIIQNGEIVIVDEFTGRLADGRKWRAGLHQAIEAREGLTVTARTGDAARVTIQDLCLQYRRLCGMTGTVADSARELRKIYRLRSLEIPTNRPPQRKRWPDQVFPTEPAKWTAIVGEVDAVHRTGRPVLIGTRSIDKSETLSELLTAAGIQHRVLNARHLSREAEIVVQAGHTGRVTVATNMAGRGTDIKLDQPAIRLGGLHVICSELHDAARIDRQLIGRCARQGDPGSFRQFMSLEDEILPNGLNPVTVKRLRRHRGNSPQQLTRFARVFSIAQRRVERKHFQARRLLLYHEQQRHTLQREMGQDPYLDAPEQ